MSTPNWQLQTPLDALVFDCDGTLSRIEGIDELAKWNQVGPQVEAMTAEAMTRSGMSPELYERRLQLVRPSQKQVLQLGKDYYRQRSPDVQEVLAVFRQLGKPIYLFSAGLYPSVALFADLLAFPREQVFAVDIFFNAEGDYLDFDHDSLLVTLSGKLEMAQALKQEHPRLFYIGDGLNDYAAHADVTRFVGYGGAYYRKNLALLCDFYLKTASFTPLLPLALTAEEVERLDAKGQNLYEQGLAAIKHQEVLIKGV